MKKTIAMTIGTMVALCAIASWARPGGHGRGKRGGEGHEMRIQRLMDSLDLDADQRAEIDRIRLAMKEDAKPLREKMKVLRKKMRGLWQAEKPSESEILKVQKKIFGVKQKLAELHVQMRIDLIDVLTPDQRAKMKELRKEKRGKGRKHGKGRGKGCSGCPHHFAD